MKLPPLHTGASPGSPSPLFADRRSERRIHMAAITFKNGWNDPANSDVRAYTTAQATTFLENYSTSLDEAINNVKCRIVVTKGCHQVGDAHFTLSEEGRSCDNAVYAGTKSVHIPC